MAHGVNSVLKRTISGVNNNIKTESGGKGIGSRRIFAPHFKLQVLDSYRNDSDCKGNQRATARKYGIHRRQIQKWLQAENTLRNSVASNKHQVAATVDQHQIKSEVALNGSRQRDDNESRVPALTGPLPTPSPLALDFTTHNRCPSPAPSPLPIDLSLKRPTSPLAAPVPKCCAPFAPLPPVSTPCHPDVWDLSTKNLKRKCTDSPSPPPKPVKLFKPYLDDIKEAEKPATPPPVKLEPCCSAALVTTLTRYETFSNNNNIYEEYNTYTLHELQPKSYFYYPPYSPEYDIGSCCYEDISYGQNITPLKQRQSYSLDFKLSAIDCYYQDELCKGNQRAVASKYNIHRRQVQKWLKQAEELRLRNDNGKQTHAVR